MSAQAKLSALVAEAERRPRAPLRLIVGAGECGRARGALAVLADLRQRVGQLGLEAEVLNGSCSGMCHAQVTVDVLRPESPRVTFGGVTPASIPALLDAVASNRPEDVPGQVIWST